MQSGSTTDPNGSTADPSTSSNTNTSTTWDAAITAQLHRQLSKIRLSILSGNLQAAKREAKVAMGMAHKCEPRASSSALFLKAHLQHMSGNHLKAAKILLAAGAAVPSDPLFSIPILNNIACISHHLSNHHISAFLFSTALRIGILPPHPLPPYLSPPLYYSCGVQLLACGRPSLAARFFLEVIFVLQKNPLVWLRLAECCIMEGEKTTACVQRSGRPCLCMRFARHCLKNALHLSKEGRDEVRQAALLDMAYVELVLENPVRIPEAMEKFPGVPRGFGPPIFYGRMYAAEALCRLGRAAEAVERMNMYVGEDGEVVAPYEMTEEVGSWEWLGGEEARRVACTNLGAALVLVGEGERGRRVAESGRTEEPVSGVEEAYLEAGNGVRGWAVVAERLRRLDRYV